MVQPMTLEAERGGSTRGAMLDPPTQQDPRLRLEIGICGVTRADGIEVLEVSHLQLTDVKDCICTSMTRKTMSGFRFSALKAPFAVLLSP